MNSSGELTSLLNRSFSSLEDSGQECIDKFNSAIHHINDWRFLLGPAMLLIRPALDEIRTNLQKMLNLIRTAVEHHLPVVSLIVQSFKWLDKIQEPVTGLTHPKNHLSSYWKGEASSAYQSKVTAQDAAVKTVAVKANDISKWLIDIAKYNVEYMTELAKMATGFAGQLVACALEAATVVEIPFAVDKLTGAIGTLVTQAMDNLVGIAKRFVEALSKVRDVVSMMTDDTLPQRSWPQAVLG
ncbi:hypothetical protein JOF53_000494 [Crossiella equi]|uniref:Uncharacterized protein n=1 Tax=Crossiella equi TaxID=130796 RepID=A0ABS5A4W4_9PSEU|nr:hypothetical protein [Crossiella equi]MBP2471622.1 hypothetical protein [Crossiella equi]